MVRTPHWYDFSHGKAWTVTLSLLALKEKADFGSGTNTAPLLASSARTAINSAIVNSSAFLFSLLLAIRLRYGRECTKRGFWVFRPSTSSISVKGAHSRVFKDMMSARTSKSTGLCSSPLSLKRDCASAAWCFSSARCSMSSQNSDYFIRRRTSFSVTSAMVRISQSL